MVAYLKSLLLIILLHVSCFGEPDDIVIEQFSVSSDGSSHDENKLSAIRPEIRSKIKTNINTPTQHPAAMGIIIKNPRPYPIKYYWWSGSNSVYQGPIGPKSVTATNSYVGHVFYFTSMDKRTNQETEFYRINVVNGINQYILPTEPGMEDDPHYVALMKEKQFVQDYYQKTGYPWLAHYPRNPPIHHMWDSDYIGQTHTVTTSETYWKCIPSSTIPTPEEIEKCHPTNNNIDIKLEVISLAPRAFFIENTLSDAECDLIVQLSNPKMKRSRAGQDGGLESNTRTSQNTWLSRKEHYILDTIYRRAADILNISETLFRPGEIGNIVEDLQVVYYEYQQEYTPHHDFGADGRPQQRYITLLYYLTDMIDDQSGGETNFPKANNGNGLAMHAGKGNSMMFYSLLPDGNADDKSLHAALPIKKGEKWLANFWVWDPQR